MVHHLEIETGLREIEYAGDGVYLGFDGYQVWAFVHDGFSVQGRIALPNDGTWSSLRQYAERRYNPPPPETADG